MTGASVTTLEPDGDQFRVVCACGYATLPLDQQRAVRKTEHHLCENHGQDCYLCAEAAR